MKSSKKIVVWIDDEIIFNQIMEDKLNSYQDIFFGDEDDKKIKFVFFSNIENANSFINDDFVKKENNIGLIILDQNMDQFTGINFAKQLRKEGKRNYKFMICSGECEIDSMKKSLELGSMSFIHKDQSIASIYCTIVHSLQHVYNNDAVFNSSRNRIIRNLATGIIAGKTNKDTKEVFEQLNKSATLLNVSVTDLSKDIINNHNFFSKLL